VLLCDEALEGFDAPAALYARETLRTLAEAVPLCCSRAT
jgi:hypothetical protein